MNTSMRVGYEAKRAFANTTGLGNYARALIQGVEKQCPHWSLYLFTPYQKITFATKAKVMLPQGPFSSAFHPLWRSSFLTQEIKDLQLDLFHGLSHEIPHGVYRNTKTLVTIHDLIYRLRPQDFSWVDRKVYDYKFLYSTRHAHKILTFTEYTKKKIIHYFKVPEKKIEIVSQSCHPAFLQRYSSEDISRYLKKLNIVRPYIHFVGSFIPRKKPWESLLAFQKVASEMDLDFVMIGQGPLKKKCQLFVREKGLLERVHFVNPFSPEDMAKCYQGSQLLLYPSVSEGFGIPLIEAHFSQIPVMTSSYSGLPEVAGQDAYYIDPDHIEQFADRLRYALISSGEREEFARRSYQWAQKQWAPSLVIEKLVKCYLSL